MSVSRRRLGVHTSIAGGIHLSLERAKALGCSTLQIFSHNPRQWSVNEIPNDVITKFRELRKAYDIKPVYIHTSYLINLAASSNEVLEKSIRLLVLEMDLADSLGADYVVLHTGSASNDTGPEARKKAIEALNSITSGKTWKAGLLLENTAGERGDISSRIEDLAEIISKTAGNLIAGVCIDTCHAFAAGYDISEKTGLSAIAAEIKTYLGAGMVKLIHLNDSKKPCGSHVDRHEHLGLGGIGSKGLKRAINHPVFRDVPLILETPKKSEEDDPMNLKVARTLLSLL